MDISPGTRPDARAALIEIDLQRWIVDAACDDAFVAAACAGATREGHDAALAELAAAGIEVVGIEVVGIEVAA